MAYPDSMKESVKRLETTRNIRLKQEMPLLSLQEKYQLLTNFHPDYRPGVHREIPVGINKGDKAVTELVDLLEARSLVEPDEINLEDIDLSSDILVIGGGEQA